MKTQKLVQILPPLPILFLGCSIAIEFKFSVRSFIFSRIVDRSAVAHLLLDVRQEAAVLFSIFDTLQARLPSLCPSAVIPFVKFFPES